jgi:hypothetical protein
VILVDCVANMYCDYDFVNVIVIVHERKKL